VSEQRITSAKSRRLVDLVRAAVERRKHLVHDLRVTERAIQKHAMLQAQLAELDRDLGELRQALEETR
jgi:hypothetical protein